MENLIEFIIYFVAIFGIFLTYISLKNYDELEEINEGHSMNIKKVEIVIKTRNCTIEEQEEVLNMIKNGKYDNIMNFVDEIKVEAY